MPRFVILRHELPAEAARSSHFDLMLEHEGELLTWAMSELPGPEARLAEELSPHRIAYLDYEGPVSNNRGIVSRLIQGEYDWLERQPDQLAVRLKSQKLKGELTIERREGQGWLASFVAS
jgi:hypothetical protein